MDRLPNELVTMILKNLDLTDLLNCSLASSRFLILTERILPGLTSLRIALADCPCLANSFEKNAVVQICQCNHHGAREFMKLLPSLVSVTSSLEIEDELVKNCVSDQHIANLLTNCAGAPITRLALSKCDFEKVQPWTVALLSQFDRLEDIELDGCKFNVPESLLIRSLSTSFATLKSLDLSNSKQVTDKFARSVSRCCPHLETFVVSGCSCISTFTVLSLIEATFFRMQDMLIVHMERTGFCPDELAKYMRSPLVANKEEWRLSPAAIPIGYDRPAVLAEHRRARCLLIYC